MDITQLNYFITIVESGCNLSMAARKIHITQSALSQLITNYESQEEVLLFDRKNGRLEKLTSSGQLLYEYALEIVKKYEEMNDMVRRESSKQKGTIRLGIPTGLMRIYFSTFLPQFIMDHKDIQIEVVEAGGNELRKQLLNEDLDYAVLVDPTQLNEKSFEEHVIQIDEFKAYMKKDHPLAKESLLNWQSLTNYPLGLFDKKFISYDLIKERLDKLAPKTEIKFTSSSWEYLLEITRYSNSVTILPVLAQRLLDKESFTSRPFKDPIPFVLLLCRPIKGFYSVAEKILHESILEYFYQPIE